jgi:hypothetical protein
VRRGVVVVKQPGLFSPKFGATSSPIFTQSPQNVAVEPGIHSLACWNRCFALPQLLYRWWHHFGIFWIPLRMRSHVFDNITEESKSPLQRCENLTSLPELLDIPTTWGVFNLRVFQITTARSCSRRGSCTVLDLNYCC